MQNHLWGAGDNSFVAVEWAPRQWLLVAGRQVLSLESGSGLTLRDPALAQADCEWPRARATMTFRQNLLPVYCLDHDLQPGAEWRQQPFVVLLKGVEGQCGAFGLACHDVAIVPKQLVHGLPLPGCMESTRSCLMGVGRCGRAVDRFDRRIAGLLDISRLASQLGLGEPVATMVGDGMLA